MQSLDVQPVFDHDNVGNDVPIKEQSKPLANGPSYEPEKREPIDSNLSDDRETQLSANNDMGHDLEKQKSQSSGGRGEVVGDQDELQAEDPNLVCLPRVGRGKDME